MSSLQELVQNYLTDSGISVRKLAEQSDIGYQALLGVVNKGTIPRKPAHRQALCKILDLDEEAWDNAISASEDRRHEAILDLPETGPMTLQQLVARELAQRGMSERELASDAEIPFATVQGITRRGTIPRTDSIKRVAATLNLDADRLADAIETSRQVRRGGGKAPRPKVAGPDDIPVLAEIVAETIRRRNQSLGAFARDLNIGYLVLAKLIERGSVPEDESILDALRGACEVTETTFRAVLEVSHDKPGAAIKPQRDELLSPDANALQRALVSYMRDQGLNLKTLAKRANLSQVTVSRLVKGGQLPSRSATHHKLQNLLSLDAPGYRCLLEQSSPSAALTAKPSTDRTERPSQSAGTTAFGGDEDDDSYLPHDHTPPMGLPAMGQDGKPPSTEEMSKLMKRLGPSQREALRQFLRSIT